MSSNIILGGAQLGLNYGITGSDNYVGKENSRAILTCAQDFGIRSVDIAYDYGNIFDWITDINPGLDLISKIKIFNCENVLNVLKKHRNIINLTCLLIHDADLFIANKSGKKKVYQLIEFCRINNIKWGISIYEVDTIRNFIAQGVIPDLVQYPYNVLYSKDEIGKICLSHNIRTQIRSVLLQGLLTLPSFDNVPAQFSKNASLKHWYGWLEEHNLNPIDTCLRSEHIMSKVKILGVQNVNQLKDLMERSQGEIIKCTSLKLSDDKTLLDPRKWMNS